MPNKLNVPSIVALNTEGTAFGTLVFMQAVQDSLKTLDENVVYKDALSTTVSQASLRARTAQGQTFSISGTAVASGDDYTALVKDFEALLGGYLKLRQEFEDFVKQVKGT